MTQSLVMAETHFPQQPESVEEMLSLQTGSRRLSGAHFWQGLQGMLSTKGTYDTVTYMDPDAKPVRSSRKFPAKLTEGRMSVMMSLYEIHVSIWPSACRQSPSMLSWRPTTMMTSLNVLRGQHCTIRAPRAHAQTKSPPAAPLC